MFDEYGVVVAARHFEGDATSPGGYRYGRGHCDPTPHAPTLWQRVRQLWQPSPFLHMVLPTGMFIHAGWFCHLWSAELRHIRRDMDSACDDMLVNFAVGARTRQPHVWYGGQPGTGYGTAGDGGWGGKGGDGGRGGHGGGGGGGASFGIYIAAGAVPLCQDNAYQGKPLPGQGGFSKGEAGQKGDSGPIAPDNVPSCAPPP